MKKTNVIILIAIMCCFCIVTGIFFLIPKKESGSIEQEKIQKICELATLKCFYHNVVEYEKEPDTIFKYGAFKFGYKKMWTEYDGVVRVGIDASQIKISEPKNGIVEIYIPNAKVLDATADMDSFNTLVVEKGIFTDITASEKAIAYSEAQKNMEEQANSDKEILNEAKENAKKLISEYVDHIGELFGTQYKIKWTEATE